MHGSATAKVERRKNGQVCVLARYDRACRQALQEASSGICSTCVIMDWNFPILNPVRVQLFLISRILVSVQQFLGHTVSHSVFVSGTSPFTTGSRRMTCEPPESKDVACRVLGLPSSQLAVSIHTGELALDRPECGSKKIPFITSHLCTFVPFGENSSGSR